MQTIIAAYIAGKNVQENYLFVLLQKIAAQYSTCKILLLVSESFSTTTNNIEVQNIGEKNKIAKAYWHNFSLPKWLKNANCFITNEKLCSKTSIPQYFFTSEDITTAKPKYFEKIKTANNIFVAQAFFKEHIDNFLPKEKTINLSLGSYTIPLALSYNQTKSIQGDYTNGYDYFLFFVNTPSTKNIIAVVKAFSILKKWQKTSMKLLLLLDNISEIDLISDFKNYKHKADVVFVHSTNENKASIIAAAFACLHFTSYNYIQNAFVAMQNKVPLITNDSALHRSIFGTAVLYSNIEDKNIAENMQQLYKDEQLKKELQIEASTILQNYAADKAAAKLYEVITAK